MNQPSSDGQSQIQDNIVRDNKVSGDFIFAPVQIGTKIETQIVEISVAKVMQRQLIKASPYQGLKRFNFKDRDRFFGRDKLIARLFEAVNRSSLSLVLGASGSGKSSAVRAGLIPELKKSLESSKFYDFIFTPNEDPFESLYRCLLSEEKDYSFSKSEAKIARKADIDTLAEVIRKLKKDDERWLIFVDQFEELFTSCHDLNKRKNFIESLVRVANSGDNSVKIMLAMRTDFLEQLGSYPALGAIANQNNIHLITDMHPDELRQAIEQPAAKHGVVFEEGLVEQIIEEVEGQSGYLPLLQYTLDLLWQTERITKAADGRPHIEDRTLNKTSYAALEGVRGALQKRVDEIYKDICQKNKDGELVTKQIFLKLVNIVESDLGKKAVSRRAYRYEFVGEPIESTLKRLIDENLLVSSYEYSSEEKLSVGESIKPKKNATIEIAHEILLSSWDKLKRWLDEEKETIILKNWLAGETRRWSEVRAKDESKANDELLKGSRLDRIVEFREKNAFEKLGGLVQEENEFIDASVKWRDRQEIEQKVQNNVERASRQLLMGRNFDVLISSLRAGVLLKKLSTVKADNLLQVLIVLQQAVYGMKEYNRLEADGDVIAVSFSPDGRLIALGTRNNTIKLWKNDGSLKTLEAHLGNVETIAFSPNGELIASASRDNTVKLWSVDGTLQNTLEGQEGHKYPVEAVAFSPNGELIASASSDDTIKLWSVDGTLQKTIQGHSAEVIGVCFSPDGQTIASASRDRTVKIWSVDGTLQKTLKGHKDAVYGVVFSPDGKLIASSSWDRTVKLWSLDGICRKTLKGHKDAVYGVVFSPDGKQIASSSWDKTVKLWSLDGICRKTLKGHDKPIEAIAFSPDGQIIVSGSKDKTVKLWKLEDISPKTLKDHKDKVYGVVFSPDGQTIVTAGKDGTVKLWSLNGICRKTIEAHKGSVLSVCFSPDGQTIVTAGKDGTVKLWSLDGTLQKTFQAHDKPVEAVAFSPDGELIATASRDKTVKLWRCHGSLLKLLNHLDQHKDEVKAVNFSPDGELIATASRDRTVKLWKRDGTYLKTLEGHNDSVFSVCFSPDSQTIASASCDNLVKLWSIDGACLDNLRDHKDWVFSVVFSPDGELIATASSDKTVKLWKRNGTYLTTLEGHNDSVFSVCFSPDGKIVASAGRDKKVILWNLDLDDLLVYGCNWVRDYLKTNLNASESDRHLCDGIGTQN